MRSSGVRLLLCCGCLCIPGLGWSQQPADSRKVKPPTSTGQFVFQLAPNSLSKNPRVDMTVYGEVTDAGKALPLPTTQQPQYYIAQSGGFHASEFAPAGERVPREEIVTQHVKKALKTAGYVESPESTTPTLVITYNWGSQYRSEMGDRDWGIATRARMVGGNAFAEELIGVLKNQQTAFEDRGMRPDGTMRVRGAAGADMIRLIQAFQSMTPVENYKRADDNNPQLLEQVRGEFYYIIVSAYDYGAMLQRKRTLLWRTHLTVDSRGVSLNDTLDVLLLSGTPYIGKETGRPGSISKTVIRRGSVEIGAPQKAEFIEESAPAKR